MRSGGCHMAGDSYHTRWLSTHGDRGTERPVPGLRVGRLARIQNQPARSAISAISGMMRRARAQGRRRDARNDPRRTGRTDPAARPDRQAAGRLLLSEGRDLRLHGRGLQLPRSVRGLRRRRRRGDRHLARRRHGARASSRQRIGCRSRCSRIQAARSPPRGTCAASSGCPARVTFVFDKAGVVRTGSSR